jgi:class 3 adenylate cyclase
MSAPRKLAAILAVNVAGYSRLTGIDEEGTLKRLRKLRRELINPAISLHRGRIVKTTGPISASLIPLQPETWRLRSMAQCWSLLPVDDLRQQPATGALRPGPVSYCGAGREALPLMFMAKLSP